jgi:hypothetical protein
MCTTIARTKLISGAARGRAAWFDFTHVTVAYDHPAHARSEHALLVDFANYDMATDARVALELDLPASKALLAHLSSAIDEIEASGLVRTSTASKE